MEEPVGAQFALQIALSTLKDRCQKYQERIRSLEEENLNLRIKCNKCENSRMQSSLSELDSLREKITELTEQNDRLQIKVKLTTSENQELWNKLGKLSVKNRTLGLHLNKINETLTQHSQMSHSPLIRSKTFTQTEPQTKVLQKNLELNGRSSLELEEISLKIINSLVKEKSEMDALSLQLSEAQYGDNIISSSFCLKCDDEDVDNNAIDDFKSVANSFYAFKDMLLSQQEKLKMCLKHIETLQEKKSIKKEYHDKSTGTVSEVPDPPKESNEELLPNNEMICPMCCKTFMYIKFEEFQQHVESHFIDDNYEML